MRLPNASAPYHAAFSPASASSSRARVVVVVRRARTRARALDAIDAVARVAVAIARVALTTRVVRRTRRRRAGGRATRRDATRREMTRFVALGRGLGAFDRGDDATRDARRRRRRRAREDATATARAVRDGARRAAPMVGKAANAVALGAALAGPGERADGARGGGRRREGGRRAAARGAFDDPDRACTNAIMIGTASAFALQILSGQAITALGAKVNERIAAGQLWRLATPIFLHGGLPHLMVNMYSLNSIGPLMEATFGREQFLAVYFGAGVAGNYASYRFCASNSVGASGAVFGLAGALAVYLQRHKRYLGERADMQLQQLGTALAVNMGFGLTSRRIDNWGHAGGLVGGAALAFLTGPNLVMETDGGYGLRRKLVNKPKLQSTIRAIKDFWDEDDEDEDER